MLTSFKIQERVRLATPSVMAALDQEAQIASLVQQGRFSWEVPPTV